MKSINIFLFVLLPLYSIVAQQTELPTERIFILPDQEYYQPGDTVRVYGQLFASGKQLVPYSKYVYVELFDGNDSVLIRKKVACRTDGSFSLPVGTDFDWPPDIYYLRAYTRLMQNFNLECFPVTKLPLGIKMKALDEKAPDVQCFFFPEGGQLVDDELQAMTVYLASSIGIPVEAQFRLMHRSDTIVKSHTMASGMQTIHFIPVKNEEYNLEVIYEGQTYFFPVPERKDGHTIQTILNRDQVTYRILSRGKTIDRERLFVFHPATGLEEIGINHKKPWGIMKTSADDSGLFMFFLTDQNLHTISQNILWKGNDTLPISVENKAYHPDEVIDYLQGDMREEFNVYRRVVTNPQIVAFAATQTELDSELTSVVPFPQDYYTLGQEQRKQNLDAWLRTARFIRFDLAQVVKSGFKYAWQPETVSLLKGTVLQKGGEPLNGGTMVAYHVATNLVYDGDIDDHGHYVVAVDDFNEGDRFFLQAHPAKGAAGHYDYKADNDTFPPVVNRFRTREHAKAEVEYRGSAGKYRLDARGEKYYLLSEVVVKAKKQTKPIPKERFYSTNYIDEETMNKRNYIRFEDIFRDIPGLLYSEGYEETGDGKLVLVRKLSTTRGSSTLKSKDIILIVDGQRMDLEEAMNIVSPQQVASVELLRPWQTNAVTYGAADGAVVITTRKSNNQQVTSKGYFYYPMGTTQGISAPDHVIKAPGTPGSYYLLMDVVTKKNKIYSYEFPLMVK